MVFEAVETMLSSISIFGLGIYLFIVAIMFGIARGITKDKEGITLYFIILGTFGFTLLFSGDLLVFTMVKTYLFLTTTLAVIVFGLTYLRSKRSER